MVLYRKAPNSYTRTALPESLTLPRPPKVTLFRSPWDPSLGKLAKR